jgi:hypothetical protein
VSDVTTTVSVASKIILPSNIDNALFAGIGAPLIIYTPAA